MAIAHSVGIHRLQPQSRWFFESRFGLDLLALENRSAGQCSGVFLHDFVASSIVDLFLVPGQHLYDKAL